MDGDHALPRPHATDRAMSLLRDSACAPARAGRRVSWNWLSFGAVALLPAALMAMYLWGVAADQYVSEFRFSVRQSPPTPIEGTAMGQGLANGTSLLAAAMDSQIVVQYIKSHQILHDLQSQLDFTAIYATGAADVVARIGAHASAESRLVYWRGVVDPYFDISNGLVSVKVRAFTAPDAERVAAAVLRLSEQLVNRLSARARQDRLAYADADVAVHDAGFRRAEQALSAYRNAHAIVFPEMHATENATLDTSLSQQIAESRAEYASLLSRGVSSDSAQLRLLGSHVAALQAQLEALRSRLTHTSAGAAQAATNPSDLATILSGYDELQVDDQIAQRAYEHALSLQQQARSDAAQQQVYLNAFVQPNLPEDSLYPQRWRTLLETLLVGCALWCLGSLLVHGVREHLH